MMLATFLAQTLRDAGLSVVEHAGWQTRGRGPLAAIRGVICHHTAGPHAPDRTPNPSLQIIIKGRADLPGPLSQLYLARDGTYHVIAAGRTNHAGAGSWQGITAGNSNLLGIEAENAGVPSDPWPEAQVAAYARGVAAILTHIDAPVTMCIGHKEWAPRRKIDPSFDMAAFRQRIAGFMGGIASTPTPAPTRTLRIRDRGEDVKTLQTRLGLPADGIFGSQTEEAVEQFQRARGLTADGVVGPRTWAALGL